MRSVRLGDVISIVAKQVDPRLPEYSLLPFINGENIESGTTRLLFRRTAAEEAVISGKYLVATGDVVYSKLRPYLRKVVVATEPGLCSADSYPLCPDLNALDPQWLAWMLASDRFTRYATDASSRARMPKLNREQLFAFRFELPNLHDQRRSAAALTRQVHTVDAARDAASESFATALSLRSRAYELAFAGSIPFSTSPTPGSSPDGWTRRKLTDLARLETGHTPSRNRPDWWGGDIPWIALPDIRRVDGRLAFETLETTNLEGIAHSAARVLPTDTVVMSRTASVGFVTRMGRPMATSQDFVNWVCGPDLDPEFLMHLLIRSRAEIRSLASGAIHKTVYFPTVKTFRVSVPPIAEQRRIAAEVRERLAAIDAMASAIRAEQEAIEALPAALLRRAFDGLAA